MKKILFALLLGATSAVAQTPCSETVRAEPTSQAATTEPSITPRSEIPCACMEDAGEAEPEPSVYDDAIALWKLDEASGTRADSIGSLDLTDNNTVGYANVGPSGTVADFVAASSEYLDRGATIPRDGTSFTVTYWAYLADPGGATVDWHVSQGNQTVWIAKYNSEVAIDVVGGGEAYAVTSVSGLPAGWHFIAAGFNSVTGKSFVRVNAGTASVSAGTSSGVTTDAAFQLGRVSGGGAGTVYYDDKMGRVGLWNAVLADSEVTSLYNSGKGKSYADLTTAEKVGLVSYWDLDEASGNRADSHGSNTLTDNNTVTSATNTYPANLPGRVASFVAANSEYLSYAGALVAADASVTVSAWVYAASDGTLSIVNDGNGDFLLRRSVGGNVDFFTRAFNDSVAESSPTITVGSWFHVVAIHDADTDTISISLNNNALATAATGGANGALTNWFVGSRSAALAFWDGYISSVAVWDRVLSDDERTALYNSGAGAPLP